MIKRVIGYLVVVAVVAIVAFTVLGAGSYESMLPEDMFGSKVEQVQQPSEEVVDIVPQESEELMLEPQDSLADDVTIANENVSDEITSEEAIAEEISE